MTGDSPKRLPIVGIFVSFVVIVAFLTTIIFILKDGGKKAAPTPEENTETAVEEEIIKERGDGAVTGSLGYPSEFIPENMSVCAEEISTGKTICTDKHLQDSSYTYGYGYRIDLPSGEYNVYAYVPNQPGSTGEVYRAYYSDFVKCGLDISCESHEPVKVTVKQGEITEGVDPQDWYK